MSSKNFFFELIKEDVFARLGKIHTHRGFIDTPAFMPVGTQGTVKSIFLDDLNIAKKSLISLKKISDKKSTKKDHRPLCIATSRDGI